MRLLHRIAVKLTSNLSAQRALKFAAKQCHFLMGMGAGSIIEDSGEVSVIQLLRRLNGSGSRQMVVFDVGANKGQFLSKLLVSTAGLELRCHSFEPSPSTFAILSGKLPEGPRHRLHNLGFGKAAGRLALFSDCEGSGSASLSKRRLDHIGVSFDRSETVEIDTLDRFCERERISQIDLLKIDVEGHELDVLSGAQGLLSLGAIKLVAFEFGGCNIDTRTFFQDFFYFFKERGYRLSRITPAGVFVPIAEYTESDEHFRTTNFLAVTPDVAGLF